MSIERKKEIILNIIKELKLSESGEIHSYDVCLPNENDLINELAADGYIEAYKEKGYVSCNKIIFGVTEKGLDFLKNK